MKLKKKIVIVEDDFDLNNKDFWENLYKLAIKDTHFEQVFRNCLDLLDKAFKYSTNKFENQKNLFKFSSNYSWEQSYLEEQVKTFKDFLKTSLNNQSIFYNKNQEIPELIKLFGICCNPKQIKNVKFIKNLINKKQPLRTKDLERYFLSMKSIKFLLNFFQNINNDNKTYYESKIADILSKKVKLKEINGSLENNSKLNQKVKKLFRILGIIENDDFMIKVMDLDSINQIIKQFNNYIKTEPEKKIEFPEILKYIMENHQLIENMFKTENKNGLIYLLGKRNHFECLENILKIEQLIELKKILGKLGEGEEDELKNKEINNGIRKEALLLEETQNQDEQEEDIQENKNTEIEINNTYKRINIKIIIECLQDNDELFKNLIKLEDTLKNKIINFFFNNKVKISFKRISFIMEGVIVDDKENKFLNSIKKKIFFLRNLPKFTTSIISVSKFLHFTDKQTIIDYYKDYFKLIEDQDNDDLIAVIASIKKLSRNLLQNIKQTQSIV